MTKYLLKRLLTGVLSACAATIIVMIMIFSLLDRNLIFAKDSVYSHQTNNAREAYKYRKWREYGYLDYVTYADYVNSLVKNGEVDAETAKTAVKLGTPTKCGWHGESPTCWTMCPTKKAACCAI